MIRLILSASIFLFIHIISVQAPAAQAISSKKNIDIVLSNLESLKGSVVNIADYYIYVELKNSKISEALPLIKKALFDCNYVILYENKPDNILSFNVIFIEAYMRNGLTGGRGAVNESKEDDLIVRDALTLTYDRQASHILPSDCETPFAPQQLTIVPPTPQGISLTLSDVEHIVDSGALEKASHAITNESEFLSITPGCETGIVNRIADLPIRQGEEPQLLLSIPSVNDFVGMTIVPQTSEVTGLTFGDIGADSNNCFQMITPEAIAFGSSSISPPKKH